MFKIYGICNVISHDKHFVLLIIIIIIIITLCKLSAFVYWREISEILFCLILIRNLLTLLPLDVYRRLMLSVGILIYSMEGLFFLIIKLIALIIGSTDPLCSYYYF
jgi:hypothetical protein